MSFKPNEPEELLHIDTYAEWVAARRILYPEYPSEPPERLSSSFNDTQPYLEVDETIVERLSSWKTGQSLNKTLTMKYPFLTLARLQQTLNTIYSEDSYLWLAILYEIIQQRHLNETATQQLQSVVNAVINHLSNEIEARYNLDNF